MIHDIDDRLGVGIQPEAQRTSRRSPSGRRRDADRAARHRQSVESVADRIEATAVKRQRAWATGQRNDAASLTTDLLGGVRDADGGLWGERRRDELAGRESLRDYEGDTSGGALLTHSPGGRKPAWRLSDVKGKAA